MYDWDVALRRALYFYAVHGCKCRVFRRRGLWQARALQPWGRDV